MTFTSLLQNAMSLYMDGKYEEAYQLISNHTELAKGNEAQYYNLKFCFAGKAGYPELALNILKESMDRGFWYSHDYLMAEEDLASLWDNPEFLEITRLCIIREQDAINNSRPEIKILYPGKGNKEKYPLIMALHGNGQNNRRTEDAWTPGIKDNYLLAMLQSSQIIFSDAYAWNDLEKGSKELEAHYQVLYKEPKVDEDKVIVGGFSGGTRTSLYTVLKDRIHVKGFLLIGPWLPELEEWEPMLDLLKKKDIKGYVICGEKDQHSLGYADKLVSYLKEKQIKHIYKLIPDMEHVYPVNFEDYLEEAMNFILN